METLRIMLRGMSPLLMHNPQNMGTNTGDPIKRKKIPTPEEEAKEFRYVQDGNLYVPAVAVRNAILDGAKGYRIGKMGAATILSGAVVLIQETFPLLRNGALLDENSYEIDTRRVVIQKQGIMRSRAMIALPWEVDCTFDFNEELANLKHVETALIAAGQIIGLLDYRPEKRGWFGRFGTQEIWTE